MKFISVCDATGIIECELFADVYRRFGRETVRNPVVEIVGKVMPFANGNGHTLQVRPYAEITRGGRWPLCAPVRKTLRSTSATGGAQKPLRRLSRARWRLPRFYPPCDYLVPLHEHPRALRHGLSG
jgi:hypothetical protein